MQIDESGKGAGVLAPPYVAFKTLLALWDRMATEGAPGRIDRSFLTGMSGGYQTQVLNAMRWLGLIEGQDGSLQPEMYDLIDPDQRKNALKTLLKGRYPEAMKLGDERATHGQLVETFRDKYGLAAETQDKAIAFFLAAARYAEVELSPFFKKPRISSGTKRKPARKKTSRAKQEAEAPETPGAEQRPEPKGKSMFSVQLRGGGTVTLMGDFDPFDLLPEERTFVFGLVDEMRAHNEGVDGPDENDEQEEEDE